MVGWPDVPAHLQFRYAVDLDGQPGFLRSGMPSAPAHGARRWCSGCRWCVVKACAYPRRAACGRPPPKKAQQVSNIEQTSFAVGGKLNGPIYLERSPRYVELLRLR
jgi:hypothetical protein